MLLVTLSADDMKRVEDILNDIVELRSDFQECQAKLEDKELSEKVSSDEMSKNSSVCVDCEEKIQTYKKLYENEKEENSLLKTKLNIFSGVKPDNKDIEIKNYKKLLKIKEYELSQLKNRINERRKTNTNKPYKVTKSESNVKTFPKLRLKEQYKKHKQARNKKILKIKKEHIVKFKAATFRTNYDSVVYDDINGKKMFVWEKGKSFTSNIKTSSWIKITGYFEKRRWKASDKNMWVKISQVSKR